MQPARARPTPRTISRSRKNSPGTTKTNCPVAPSEHKPPSGRTHILGEVGLLLRHARSFGRLFFKADEGSNDQGTHPPPGGPSRRRPPRKPEGRGRLRATSGPAARRQPSAVAGGGH